MKIEVIDVSFKVDVSIVLSEDKSKWLVTYSHTLFRWKTAIQRLGGRNIEREREIELVEHWAGKEFRKVRLGCGYGE